MPWDYLAVAGIVFAINLLPAFGPPTSAVLVALTLSFDLASVPLIASGAVAAACGRYVLASGARRVRPHLSAERRVHLAAAERYLVENRARTIAGLGLFALSPVPSGQLFTGAGLMEVPLLPLTAAFFAGRLLSYTIYVTAASAVKDTFGQAVVDTITSPIGIVVQVVALAALVALVRIDWAHILGRKAMGVPGANRMTTRDGATLTVRPISAEDKEALAAAFEHLSPESRYRRFLAPVDELSPSQLAYLTEVDHRDHEALVAVTPDGEIVGVARYVRLAERPTTADAAVAVLDDWQGRGVGTELLRRLATSAREADVESFTASCFAWNHEIQDLLHELGPHTRTRSEGGGVVELEVELPTADEQRALRPALRAAAGGRIRPQPWRRWTDP